MKRQTIDRETFKNDTRRNLRRQTSPSVPPPAELDDASSLILAYSHYLTIWKHDLTTKLDCYNVLQTQPRPQLTCTGKFISQK